MNRHAAVNGGSDTEPAADLPLSADDAGSGEQLRPTPEHSALLRLPTTAGRGAMGYGADIPPVLRAVDAGGAKTAAELPGDVPAVDGAGRSPTAGLPAGDPAVADRLHEPLQ